MTSHLMAAKYDKAMLATLKVQVNMFLLFPCKAENCDVHKFAFVTIMSWPLSCFIIHYSLLFISFNQFPDINS